MEIFKDIGGKISNFWQTKEQNISVTVCEQTYRFW